MRKAQAGAGMLTAVVVALVIPLVILIMFVVQANMENSTESTLTVSVTDEPLAPGLNATALSLGNNYIFEDTGITFNASGLTEGTNYTVDYDAGTLTWTAYGTENTSSYVIDYEYFVDRVHSAYTSVNANAANAYDMAGILPIAIVGIAVLSAVIGALAGFVFLRR